MQVLARGAGFCPRRREPPARQKSNSLRRLPNSEKCDSRARTLRNRPRMPFGRFGRTPVRPRLRSSIWRPVPVRRRRETRHGWDEGHRNPEHGSRDTEPGGQRRPSASTITSENGQRERGEGDREEERPAAPWRSPRGEQDGCNVARASNRISPDRCGRRGTARGAGGGAGAACRGRRGGTWLARWDSESSRRGGSWKA